MVLHTGIHCFRETDWKRIDIAACRQQRNKDADTGKHNAFTCMRMSCICPNALIWKGIENKVLQPGSLLKREKKKKTRRKPQHTPKSTAWHYTYACRLALLLCQFHCKCWLCICLTTGGQNQQLQNPALPNFALRQKNTEVWTELSEL